MKRKIGVKAHKRFDPRLNKKVDVNQYNRNQDIKPYKNLRTTQIATGLTHHNIGYIQYKILELIKLNANYDAKTTMSDLYDELTFDIENEKAIRDMVENLRSQGLLNMKSLTPTKEGNRVFWEFFKENDGDNESLELLKDNPYLKKEGFEIIGSKEYPNETLLYLKDYNKIDEDQWMILEYIQYNSESSKKGLDVNEISNHLDFNEAKVKKAIRNLRDEKILSQKQLKITKAGMKIKHSFEEKYDPFP